MFDILSWLQYLFLSFTVGVSAVLGVGVGFVLLKTLKHKRRPVKSFNDNLLENLTRMTEFIDSAVIGAKFAYKLIDSLGLAIPSAISIRVPEVVTNNPVGLADSVGSTDTKEEPVPSTTNTDDKPTTKNEKLRKEFEAMTGVSVEAALKNVGEQFSKLLDVIPEQVIHVD